MSLAATPLPPALTTGEMAALINAILGGAVYDKRAILAEIDAGEMRAFNVSAKKRRAMRVTEGEFLRWSAKVLREDEVARLRAAIEALALAS